MNTVLKKQILGALCWEQKDSFKDLLLNLVYRIFLFAEPSKVFSIIRFSDVFIFARIKRCSFLKRTVPSAASWFPVFSGWNVTRENWQWRFFPQTSLCPPVLTRAPATSSLLPVSQDCCRCHCARTPAFSLTSTSVAAQQQSPGVTVLSLNNSGWL